MHVGSQTVKEVLEPWNICVTEDLIEKWKHRQEQKMAQAAQQLARNCRSDLASSIHPHICGASTAQLS